MGLYGANELPIRRFGGGLVRDQDPTEIGDDQASDAQNVDFEDETLTKRLGRAVFNETAPTASAVRGVYRYYGRDGGNGKFLLQAGTSIYEDNGSGGLVGGAGNGAGDAGGVGAALTGGAPMDFLGWKERVYAGNGVDSVRRRTSDATWKAVTLIAGPTAPTVTPAQAVAEAFDSGTWTLSGGALTNGSDPADYNAALKREGSACFKLKASGTAALGSFVHKAWSGATVTTTSFSGSLPNNATPVTLTVGSTTGFAVGDYVQIQAEVLLVTAINSGTSMSLNRAQGSSSTASHSAGTLTKTALDLSKAQFLSLWVYSEKTGMVYQVGVKDNSGVLDFSLFPNFTAVERETWVRIRVPLDKIPPADRTASMGLGIKFLEKGSANPFPGPAVSLFFDEARPEGPLVPDHYSYYLTYAETETTHGTDVVVRESNPSPAAELDVPVNDALLGVQVAVSYSTDSTVTQVLVYRRRRDGPFSRARLVKTLPNNSGGGTTSFTDTLGEDEVALSDAAELVGSKIAPPIAKTYAVANSRLVAAHAYVGSTWYPWRLYLSRLGYPEEFGGDREPTDPNAPGWLDIATRDHIRRLVEFDGQLLVFCDRGIYTLEGSGWDDFAFRKRADVGLDAREAVAVYDRFVFFLADDGVRVLAPNRSFDGLFETWVVSEPVDGVLRRIPAAYRSNTAFGLDERGRLHVSYTPPGQTVNREALVFDPTSGQALQPGYNSVRRGWTQYTNWGFSCFCSLKRGGGDAGQLVGGDPATARLHYLQRDPTDTALQADGASTLAEDLDLTETGVTVADGSRFYVGEVVRVGAEAMLIGGVSGNDLTVTRGYLGTTAATHTNDDAITGLISWHWQGKAQDAGPGMHLEWVFVGAEFDAAAGERVTATPVLEGAPSPTPFTLPLGAASSGFVSALQRCGAAVRGRFSALRLSGSQGVGLKCRSARIGGYLR